MRFQSWQRDAVPNSGTSDPPLQCARLLHNPSSPTRAVTEQCITKCIKNCQALSQSVAKMLSANHATQVYHNKKKKTSTTCSLNALLPYRTLDPPHFGISTFQSPTLRHHANYIGQMTSGCVDMSWTNETIFRRNLEAHFSRPTCPGVSPDMFWSISGGFTHYL